LKIVEYLDLLNKINKTNENKINDLEELIKSHLLLSINFDKNIEIKTLGEITDMSIKGKINSKEISNTGEYPFYKASVNNPSGTHNIYCYDDNEYILFIKSGGNAVNPLSLSLGIGKVYYVNGKSCGNTEVIKIITTNKIIKLKYLYYYLQNQQLNIQKLAKYTTNLGHIDINKFKELEIPIPSLDKQEEIVNYLDLLNSNIGILKKEIELNKKLAEEFMKSALI
jgi:restriction endonuclease S subunit